MDMEKADGSIYGPAGVQDMNCPHCGARTIEFKVPLSKNNIHVLFTIYKMTDQGIKHIKTKDLYNKIHSSSPTAELTRLKYLGAIKPYFTQEDLKKESHRSGKWTLTERGRLFMEKKIGLPSYVIVRNKKAIEEGEEWMADNTALKWHKEDEIWQIMKDFWSTL